MSLDVSDRTLAALGFDEIRGAIASRCRSEVGQARARARPFLPSHEEVRASLALVEEARALRAEPLSLPLSGVTDVTTSVERASKGGLLEPRELIAVCHALFAFERAGEMLDERRARLPGLCAVGLRLPQLGKLAARLDRSFETSGELSDRASAGLRDARATARALHQRIRGRLDELLRDEKFSASLREGYYSVRHDRYVVPVRASHQREVQGIVHNASQSGQTLFVEPQEMVSLGNELAIALSVVVEEERKVLLELSGLVGREAGRIADGVHAAAQLDELEAAAVLANDLLATPPELTSSDGELHLKALRHPRLVLKGGEIVANDVDLSGASRVLVVSGPNAGGKTVTLTGVGLCALMARAGLPVPCDQGSVLPLFNAVHSAIGDQQDLQQGLSTFSAHITLLRDIVSSARGGSLVLVDEIAADTDPREGAAIATAVLEELLSKGSLVLVTTHLEELKSLAHLDSRFVNARVGFDSRKMAPTYRLQLGFAGASSAVDIARRAGLPEAICNRAVELIRNAGGALSRALAAAEDERRQLFDRRDSAERDAREARVLKESLEAELAAVQGKRKEEELRFREALRAELEFARRQIRALVEKLEEGRSEQTLRAAQAAAAELSVRIEQQAAAERGARLELKVGQDELLPLKLEPGARARHKRLEADVEILDLVGDFATVAMGALKMRVPVSELGPGRKPKDAPRFAVAPGKAEQLQKAEAASAQVLTLASPTLDLRGQRTEDALRQVEQFLDRAARTGDEAAIVIHGHGTGALKSAVREYLQRSPYAKTFRGGDASEGGDGVTVVVL